MWESSVSRSKCRCSVPGGTAASVRFRKDSRARAGASSRASPSGELRAMHTTPWPWLRDGQTLTSPVPVGRCRPSASRSRANTHSTVSSAPVWKVACTAYGSAVSYRRPAGTGREDSLDTTRRRCSSQLTVVFISARAFRSVCARGFARRRNRHATYGAVVNPSECFACVYVTHPAERLFERYDHSGDWVLSGRAWLYEYGE